MTALRPVEARHKDVVLKGQIALPEGRGPHPAVLVAPTAQGLGERAFGVARKLAELGYAGVAVDFYGDGLFHTKPMESVLSLCAMYEGEPGRLRARMVAWYEAVKKIPEIDPARIAAIGYCMGGEGVLELARSGADVKLVVCFHGAMTTHAPAQRGAVKALVAAYGGAHDPYVPLEDVAAFQQEMIDADARWHSTVFGPAAHSFTDPNVAKGLPGMFYEPLSDKMSWAGMRMLLEEVFEPA